jgi:hypothetical protein
LHPRSEFPGRAQYWFTSSISPNISTWTYHVFNESKVIIMGNGYGVLRFGILGAFLQKTSENNNREQSCLDRQTSTI